MRWKQYSFSVLVGLAAKVALGQDPQLSQFHAAPLYLNPALTGNTAQDRIALNYRLQWPGVQPGFETYAFSYDHRFRNSPSGLGGYVMRDKAGSNGLFFNTVALSYSYEARLNRKHAVRMGLRMAHGSRGVDPSGFLFADQVIRDNAARSIEMGVVERIGFLDMAFGGLWYTDRAWLGVSANHLNRPNMSLFEGSETRLDMRTSVHGGYRLPLDGRPHNRSEQVLTLTSHYKSQGKWDQLDMGAYIEYQRVTAGAWYRGIPLFKAYKEGYTNNEAFVLLVGFETNEQLHIAYSYDITISKLTMASAGAHELSLIYEWPRKAKNRRHKVVPCPKF